MAKAKCMLAQVCNSDCDKVYTKLDDTVCARYDDVRLRRRSSSKTLLLPVGVLAVIACLTLYCPRPFGLLQKSLSSCCFACCVGSCTDILLVLQLLLKGPLFAAWLGFAEGHCRWLATDTHCGSCLLCLSGRLVTCFQAALHSDPAVYEAILDFLYAGCWLCKAC